ncbi:MAG: DUF2059 domain-containing protein [Psychrosphaera sp.]|nr:DUF2059 domain-containing protein [Psychrosphaera sp.]
MTKHSFKMAATLLLLAQCTFGFAAHAGDSVEKLLELSGGNKAIEAMPGAVKGGMMQAKQGMPEPLFDKIVASVDSSIKPDVIKKTLKAAISKSMTDKEVAELLTWYESDLGKELVKAESVNNSPEAYVQMQQQAQKLFADAPRVAIAKRYDSLIGATDAMIDMQVSSGAAIYSAMAAIAKPDTAPDLSQFKSMIAAQMAPMRSQMESIVIMSFVYAHQTTDMAKLKKYEAFLNTPTAVKFNKIALKGMLGGFEKTIVTWAGTVAKMAKENATQAE